MGNDLAAGDSSGSIGIGASSPPWQGLSEPIEELGLDPWAWAAIEHEPVRIDVSDMHVTAVLVAHNAADWLPETLTGLRSLERRPQRLIAIDHGSDDETLDLLDAACDDGVFDAVYTGAYDAGFGDGVRSALDQDAMEYARPPDGWLWLLHDDAVAAPDVLEQLLVTVAADPGVVVTGPKLLVPHRPGQPHQLSELGVSISGTGRRELFLDRGEIDQGQRDVAAERLAVGSCGMLVSATVWSELGGFNPAIPVFRDGTEFGWRARLVGHRVVTSPHAAMVHRQVGRAGLRPGAAAGWRPNSTDRALGMALVAGHAPAVLRPLVVLRLVLGGVLRSFGYLLGKAPKRSVDELIAAWSLLAHPGRVRAVRTSLARIAGDQENRRTVRALRPPRWSSTRLGVETFASAVADRYRWLVGDPESSSLDELTGDDFAGHDEPRTRVWLSPVVVTVVLAAVASLVAARNLLGGGSLTGPALLPAPTLTQLWHAFLHPVPGGANGGGAPWLGLTAAGATVLAGRPEWLVTLLLMFVVPLALLSSYPVVRVSIGNRGLRLWVAGSYGLLPVLLGGTNQGRLGLAVAAVALPPLVLSAQALVRRRPGYPGAWRGGWAAGLVLVVLVAFEPVLFALALLVGLVAVLTVARTPRKAGRVGVALGVPLLVLTPWWPTVIGTWGRALTGPDPALDGVLGVGPASAPSSWLLLLGRVGDGRFDAGLPPLWLAALCFGAIWLVALVGLGRRSGRLAVRAGWLVALSALAFAVLVSRLVVAVPPSGAQVRPWTAVLLLVAFAALLLVGGMGVDGLRRDLAQQGFGLRQPAAVVLSVALVGVGLVGAGWWVVAGAAGPVSRTGATALPSYVRLEQTGPRQVRTVAIDLAGSADGDGGTVTYAVLAGEGIRLGDAERGFAFGGSAAANAEATGLVARLVAGTADEDLASQLAACGVGYIWVHAASEEQRARIANTPGLRLASGTGDDAVWQLTAPVARAMVVSGGAAAPLALGRLDDGRAVAVDLPPAATERTLRLAEPADQRWSATLNGMALTPVVDGWRQAYALPRDGGRLELRLRGSSPWWAAGQGMVLLVVAVLAAPAIRRPEVRHQGRSSRRTAGLPAAPPEPVPLPSPADLAAAGGVQGPGSDGLLTDAETDH